MDRSQTMQVLDGSGWITQARSYSRGARRTRWRPCTVTKSNRPVASSGLSRAHLHTEPLHTVALDARRRSKGGPPRPLSRSNTKTDGEYVRQTDRLYWDA
eukprot:COSAG05_NODE_16389_length_347_cov_0.826613_1_plen_99_part_10